MKRKKTVVPLAPRISKTPYMSDNSLVRSISVVSPEFVYYYLNQIVTLGCAYLIGTGQYGTVQSERFTQHSMFWAAFIRVMAVIIAVLPLIWSFIKEYPVLLPKENKRTKHIVYTFLIASGLALLLNVIAHETGFSSVSDSFGKTSSAQFSLPIWAGVAIYGIITPVTEEIVHRGIIYNRLRRYFNLPVAVCGSAILFGISHGNLVQFVYGFSMGIVICLIYERYGAFLYPVLFHCIANSTVYIFMSLPVVREWVFSTPGIAVETVVSVIAVYLIFAGKESS